MSSRATSATRNQAFDLALLTALARAAWPRLEGKTHITLAELDECEVLADQLLTAVGERAQLPVVAESAADIRVRAFTLFLDLREERSVGRVIRAAVAIKSWIAQTTVGGGSSSRTLRWLRRSQPPAGRPAERAWTGADVAPGARGARGGQ